MTKEFIESLPNGTFLWYHKHCETDKILGYVQRDVNGSLRFKMIRKKLKILPWPIKTLSSYEIATESEVFLWKLENE